MEWSKPDMVEVNMSAEIGAYQGDAEEGDGVPLAPPGAAVVIDPIDDH
ncbi:MAG TPA: hypothetical protein VK540_04750 [Polyangiaceae bacterium]|jgi:hypothetical protein|nr:hypothetical protein [Polyangiaceae bacterium]